MVFGLADMCLDNMGWAAVKHDNHETVHLKPSVLVCASKSPTCTRRIYRPTSVHCGKL